MSSATLQQEEPQVIIIGGGPAGYTSALYAARAALRPLVIAGYASGGQLMLTTKVENFPGFPRGVEGPDLMGLFRDQAEFHGARVVEEDAVEVDFGSPGNLQVKTDTRTWAAPTVIVATGASARRLGVPGEEALLGRGVATCAVCDGAHFRGLKVAVAGGGDSAMEEVLQLSRIASEIHVIHRRDSLRASRVMQERVQALSQVRFRWNTEVEAVLGERRVTGLRLRDACDGRERDEPFDGLFVAVGHVPNTALFRGQLPMRKDKYIETRDGETVTSVPGVFVAGDAFDVKYRQAVTAAASGCKAALEAERYLLLATPAAVA